MSDSENPSNQPDDDTPAADEQHDRTAQPTGSEEPPRIDFPVVGIGASAGGLEAFIEFFDAMPADAGLAYVLIQHLAPDRESMVAEILAKHTRMPVVQVEDGMAVDRDHVYVIRPGRTLTIRDGKLHLGEPLKTPGHNRPVDDFFRSLAEEQRERSICIVMSGMGSNGSSGAEAIKAVGGAVIAQEPESAKFPSMPRHLLESGNADFVLRPAEMPNLLVRYAGHPYVRGVSLENTAAQRDLRALGEVLAMLRARTRRDFSGYKKPTVLRRIQRRMGLNQIESLPEYATFLRQNTAEAPALSDDLMIHVTGFFRDPDSWEILSEAIIAPLIEERENDAAIRCWVTACSSGEEAYTLSMLLWEAAEAAGKQFDIKVFATDMAERSLAKGRMGVFPLGIEAEVSPERLERFFERDDATYRVKKELRELVVFAPQNVVQDPPFSRLDIATCRNLLIYLEPELQRRVLTLLHFGLREGGTLFLGSSETVNGVEELFEPVDKRARIFRRVGPTRHGAVEFAFPQSTLGAGADQANLRTGARLTIAQLTQRNLLDRHTPAAVTIDREHRIVYFHGNTTPYLMQPPGEPTRELLSMVRENVRGAVRAALHESVMENRAVTSRDGFIQAENGRYRIEVTAEPLEAKAGSGYYLISFAQVPDAPRPPALDEPHESEDVTELHAELGRVRDELQSTIEELQTTNEEMRASNEETMSINEELQSTNEELETSKEELQSLNEELTTVNVQLQTKMEEHEATSNDLSSLLASTDIAVLFLDRRLRIRRYTPAVKGLLELIPSDVGRPISDLHKKFMDDTLLEDCQTVLDKLAPIEKEVASDSGRSYVRRVLPYRTEDNRISGVVLTFIDVTALKRAETARHESEERFRLVIEGAPDFAMLLTDLEGLIVAWNAGAEKMLGYSQTEAIGRHASIIYPGAEGKLQAAREMEKAARDGRAIDEAWHVRKDGSLLWGSGVLTAVHSSDGELSGFVKVLRDETARKNAETERDKLLASEQSARREAETANSMKDQFIARLSHELRTPLSSIVMWIDMLQNADLSDEDRHEGLHVIERSATAQRQLLDDLLDTSRIASGKMRLNRIDIRLEPVVRQAIDSLAPLARDRKVEVHSHLGDNGALVHGDAERLRQVVGNLLTNAIKFTPAGGQVAVSLALNDGQAELRVTDTGLGIDGRYMPYLFTPFSQADVSSTRRFGGLGLGLAICKELVELHGGTIRAESGGPEQGSTFIVELPLAAARVDGVQGADGPIHEPADLHAVVGANILLVEDDEATRDAVQRVLKAHGARLTAVASADDGFAVYQQAAPDLIISDIGLPGEDGNSLLRRIRASEAVRGHAPIPAIALSAFAGERRRKEAEGVGFNEHLDKPATAAALLDAIVRLLSERRRTGES